MSKLCYNILEHIIRQRDSYLIMFALRKINNNNTYYYSLVLQEYQWVFYQQLNQLWLLFGTHVYLLKSFLLRPFSKDVKLDNKTLLMVMRTLINIVKLATIISTICFVPKYTFGKTRSPKVFLYCLFIQLSVKSAHIWGLIP